MKDKFVSLLAPIQRTGIMELSIFLFEKSDFLTAPASTKHHLAVEGGLAIHTLNVIECARCFNNTYKVVPDESVVIAALAHDFCKINYYVETDEPPTDAQMRYLVGLCQRHKIPVPAKLNKAFAGDLIGYLKANKPEGKFPEYRKNYAVKDELPLGHGEKSLFVVNQFINLTKEEALAIRWHMGAWDLNLNSTYQRHAFPDAQKASKLLTILIMADTEATHLIEEQ